MSRPTFCLTRYPARFYGEDDLVDRALLCQLHTLAGVLGAVGQVSV